MGLVSYGRRQGGLVEVEGVRVAGAVGGVVGDALGEAAGDVGNDGVGEAGGVDGLGFLVHEAVVGVERVDDDAGGADADGTAAGGADGLGGVVGPGAA